MPPHSLSLSRSLSLYFYDLLSKFSRWSSDVPDQGQTSIPRVIIYKTLRPMTTEHFRQAPSFRCMPFADPEGEGVRTPPPPLKNHKNIGFPSNIDPDPLKITKLPCQRSMKGHWHGSKMPFQRRFADGPMVVHFSGISVLSHYPLWQNVLDPRMHAVRVNRLDWN